ncbi:Uu.00g096180.m01.CDS01 [Anthostomella pinea]|uniref:Uu.00g096180.m01.CDS01 n=1 Tax=Anthostomella pinea TaxID=933095 RepID=A0AAI8VC22_9PEZI|nr:Uu.00g096180.m01.CDS01 [Anthostomella pinea]
MDHQSTDDWQYAQDATAIPQSVDANGQQNANFTQEPFFATFQPQTQHGAPYQLYNASEESYTNAYHEPNLAGGGIQQHNGPNGGVQHHNGTGGGLPAQGHPYYQSGSPYQFQPHGGQDMNLQYGGSQLPANAEYTRHSQQGNFPSFSAQQHPPTRPYQGDFPASAWAERPASTPAAYDQPRFIDPAQDTSYQPMDIEHHGSGRQTPQQMQYTAPPPQNSLVSQPSYPYLSPMQFVDAGGPSQVQQYHSPQTSSYAAARAPRQSAYSAPLAVQPAGAAAQLSRPSSTGVAGQAEPWKVVSPNVLTPTQPRIVQTLPGPDYEPLEGCTNFWISKKPVIPQIPPNTKKASVLVASHNLSGTPLLPGRFLPCEIARDHQELQTRFPDAPESEKQSLQAGMDALDKKMFNLTGTKVPKVKEKAKKSASSGDSSSDSESETDETSKLAEQIMAAKRPVDPVEAVRYDVVRIFRKDYEEVGAKKVGITVGAFGEYVTKLWNTIKDLRKRLESAQDKIATDQQDQQILQAALAHHQEQLRTALQAALEFGDTHTLRNLGGHDKIVVSLFNGLRHQLMTKNYNSPLAKTILQLASQFTHLDTTYLTEKLKLHKVRDKFYNELDANGKKWMDQIFNNAKLETAEQKPAKPLEALDKAKLPIPAVLKATASAIKTPGTTVKPQATKLEVPQKKELAAVKKILPTDYSGLGSARKVSSTAAKPNAFGSPAKRPRDDDVEFRAPKKVAVEGASGVPVTTKIPSTTTPTAQISQTSTTPATVRARPSSSLLLGKARAPAKSQTKKPEPPSSTSSTISGLLAEIAKPAATPKQKEITRTPETPEEKARRLHKEKRRHLRVMWKPDHELTEIRIFEHDQAEDEGRATSMVKDARDNRSEGQMLKMHRGAQEDDEEEDGGKPKEVNIRPWVAASKTDFSSVDQQQRGKVFVTRGGLREVQSEQKKIMDEYENRELMAIYTTPSEIPDTPRSPPNKATERSVAPRIGQLPSTDAKFVETHRRWAEVGQFGTTITSRMALQRLGIQAPSADGPHMKGHGPMAPQSSHLPSHVANMSSMSNSMSRQPSHAPRVKTQAENDAEVLALLTSARVKNWDDPDPYDPANPKTRRRHDYGDPKVQAAADAIEAVAAQLAGKPFPATEPPTWMQSDPDRVKEWHTGRNNDIAAKAKKEAIERAARLSEAQARKSLESAQASQAPAQPGIYAPYQMQHLHQALPQHQPYQAAPQVPDQYAAILQQVQALQGAQPVQNAAPVAPQLAPPQPANSLQTLLAALGQVGQAPQASQAPAPTPDYGNWQQWAPYQASQAQQPHGAPAQSHGAQSFGIQYDGTSHDGQAYGSHFQGYQAHQAQPQGAQHSRDNDRGNRKDVHRGNKEPLKGINRSLIGTKPCSFWAKGQCAKGDSCTFRHDPNDLK